MNSATEVTFTYQTVRIMSRLYLFVLSLAMLLFPLQALAQPTITAADLSAQSGAAFFEFLAGDNAGALPDDLSVLPSLLLASGANTTFDFTAITSHLPLFSTNKYINLPTDSLDLPGFEAFFKDKASDVWQVTLLNSDAPDVFLYRRIAGDSLLWLGNGLWQDTNADGIADPVVSVFNPGKLQAPLPLEFNNAWTTSFVHKSVVNSPIGVIEVSGITENHDIKIDGYGTLVTHTGTYPCLRIRINQTIENIDGSTQEIGGWSFLTKDLVQLGVFYDQLIPDNPADISFDLLTPQSISLFSPEDPGTSIANEVPEGTLPTSHSIGQNYPNPFINDTVIPFELFNAGHVTLDIYNATGQLIAPLIDQTMPAGAHKIAWAAQNQPAGLYYYRISFNGIQRHNIMVRLK